MIQKIDCWSINEDACTGSDHEVIDFSINVNVETVNNSINALFNVRKANWVDFDRFLKANYEFIKFRMNELIGNSTAMKLNKTSEYLRNVIVNAADQFIFKRRPCDKSKV